MLRCQPRLSGRGAESTRPMIAAPVRLREAARIRRHTRGCTVYAGPREGQGMQVPPLSGQSPERKAACALRALFTHVAARVVLAQLQGPAGPTSTGHTTYGMQDYLDLMDFLGVPIKGDGGDEWLGAVMKKNHALALRLMEVREAYLEEFSWEQVIDIASRETREANTKLMRAAAMASLHASMAEPLHGGKRSADSGDDPAVGAGPSQA